MSIQAITRETCVVRDTASHTGRKWRVEPGTTAARHLHYGRIILAQGDASVRFETNDLETGLICLKGSAVVKAEGAAHALGRYDTLYIPRDTSVEVAPGPDGCDVAEIASPVARRHPVQFVSFSDVQNDAGLHFAAGGPGAQRELNILLGKNVRAGRLMAGVTFSAPGNWTSWPPHEHAVLAEEAYLYIDMPAPAFGVQLVYTDKSDPEVATIVREGDVVLMPAGYHPNVAAPGGAINFLWFMAANREDDDRLFGVVNVHPDFAATGSGLDKGEEMIAGDWKGIKAEKIAEGIERQMIWGEKLMVCRLRIGAGVVTPVHSHPHEQITMVERGRVRYIVAGEKRVVSAGDVLYFAPNVEHGATMLDEEVVLVDAFSPVREEFLP